MRSVEHQTKSFRTEMTIIRWICGFTLKVVDLRGLLGQDTWNLLSARWSRSANWDVAFVDIKSAFESYIFDSVNRNALCKALHGRGYSHWRPSHTCWRYSKNQQSILPLFCHNIWCSPGMCPSSTIPCLYWLNTKSFRTRCGYYYQTTSLHWRCCHFMSHETQAAST